MANLSIVVNPVAWHIPHYRTALVDGLIRSARLCGAVGEINVVEPSESDLSMIDPVITAVW